MRIALNLDNRHYQSENENMESLSANLSYKKGDRVLVKQSKDKWRVADVTRATTELTYVVYPNGEKNSFKTSTRNAFALVTLKGSNTKTYSDAEAAALKEKQKLVEKKEKLESEPKPKVVKLLKTPLALPESEKQGTTASTRVKAIAALEKEHGAITPLSVSDYDWDKFLNNFVNSSRHSDGALLEIFRTSAGGSVENIKGFRFPVIYLNPPALFNKALFLKKLRVLQTQAKLLKTASGSLPANRFKTKDWQWAGDIEQLVKKGVLPSARFYAYVTGLEMPELVDYHGMTPFASTRVKVKPPKHDPLNPNMPETVVVTHDETVNSTKKFTLAEAKARLAPYKAFDLKLMRGKEWNDIFNGNSEVSYNPATKTYMEGFWRTAKEWKKLDLYQPFPIPFTPRNFNRKNFVAALQVIEKKAQTRKSKGTSPHRWTGKPNGDAQHQYTVKGVTFIWPEGYINYIKAGVPPTREFYKFVTGKDLPSLPSYYGKGGDSGSSSSDPKTEKPATVIVNEKLPGQAEKFRKNYKPRVETPKVGKVTPQEGAKALEEVRSFFTSSQVRALMSGMRGEEKEFFAKKAVEMANIIKTMPKTYEQDGKGMDAVAYLHYFSGSSDWYITEKDMGVSVDQSFGYADLYGDGDGELGYINIRELTRNNVELDLYWEPKTLKEIISAKKKPAEKSKPDAKATKKANEKEFFDGSGELKLKRRPYK